MHPSQSQTCVIHPALHAFFVTVEEAVEKIPLSNEGVWCASTRGCHPLRLHINDNNGSSPSLVFWGGRDAADTARF